MIPMDILRHRLDSEDDIEEEELFHDNGASTRNKSRKPPNTAFRQQRLKAWQPILTPNAVIPLLFLVAAIFAPLGISIFFTTYNVLALSVDYSECGSLVSDTLELIPTKNVHYHFIKQNIAPNCKWQVLNSTSNTNELLQQCRIQFDSPIDIQPPVYLYYGLTNFFQNHRKYVELYDIGQINGKAVELDSLSDTCNPLKTAGDSIIYPCGLIANSFFNDLFKNPVLLNAHNGAINVTYEFSQFDISWPSDRTSKYKKTEYNASQITPPPNWAKMFPQGYNDTNIPDLLQWELLQNWMRTAGLPSFYKLAGKNTSEPLTLGTYELLIDLNYPVQAFGGTKSFVITTNSVFGARNMALGVIYLILAIVSLVLAIGFLVQYLVKPRRLGDHKYLQSSGRPELLMGSVALREAL